MTKRLLSAFAAALVCVAASSQSIQTASEFFKSVSDYYATIKDYEADIEIKAGKSEMQGKVSYKSPEMLRIDFSSPSNQVILYNGEKLTIYLPGTEAILEQVTDGSAAGAATAQGLSLFRRYYTISYETGQAAVPLEDGSDEMVVNLVLRRRTSSEAFSVIRLSVSPDTKLIRRVSARTPQGTSYVFDFTDYNVNANIPDQRFLYDAPSSANIYNNFLFSD